MQNINITTEFTPNPNSLKFNASAPLCSHGPVQFASRAEAGKSPLAAKLFEIEGVQTVMIGPDFVTVTRSEKISTWALLIPKVSETIREFISCGGNPKICNNCAEVSAPHSEVEKKILDILNEQIRPALARDGGDVRFCGFEDGVVKLHLKGACSGCPSAAITLKMGIEAYLKEYIPEVKEVVRV
ncbi:MAG TPA: NifU family protein [Candidatus Omnitrophota bacterium]|nr:NifU family protein [Candidatus Omnitrophota bacterium]HPS37184.1 NifU family protein [Candidatus Omnitrophota bacterium]